MDQKLPDVVFVDLDRSRVDVFDELTEDRGVHSRQLNLCIKAGENAHIGNSSIPGTDKDRLIRAFENKCYRRTLGLSHREHKTNECAWGTSEAFAVNRQASQAIILRPCVSS